MGNAIALEHLQSCQKQDFQIEKQTHIFGVIGIIANLNRYRQLVPSVHLRPACETRPDEMYALFGTQGNKICLVESAGLGPTKLMSPAMMLHN